MNNLPHCMGQPQRPQQISPTQPLTSSYDSSNDHRIPRRTFGLFCLCDFLLVFLLWTIMLSIKKKSQTFLQMFSYEINHYKISTSMADVVLLSITRDSVLVLVYLMMSGNHWMVAALCAVCSSAFLLTKVFLYPMSDSGQPVTYFTILGSFAMTWIATYMVDFKKLRNYANQSGKSFLNISSLISYFKWWKENHLFNIQVLLHEICQLLKKATLLAKKFFQVCRRMRQFFSE